MLLYNDLTAHSETRALIPCLVFIAKQVREDGAKALMLKVYFFSHGSHSWKGQNTPIRILRGPILRGASGKFELSGLFFN